MIRILLLIGILSVTLTATPASAETLTGGYPICMTEEFYDRMVALLLRNDKTGYDYLIKSGVCGPAKAGLQISVLQSSFYSKKAKIRIYLPSGSAPVVWTLTDNITP